MTASVFLSSALARTLDLRVPSNRWAAAGLLGGAALARLGGRSWVSSASTGLSAFAAWATARELDPDHPMTANAALPVTLALALLEKEENTAQAAGNILAALVALSSARILTASVGRVPSATDQAALAAQAVMGAAAGQHAAALLPGASLALSAQQNDEFALKESWSAAAALIAGLLPALLSTHAPGKAGMAELATAGALLAAPQLLERRAVSSETDAGHSTISSERVHLSHLLALGGLALGGVLGQSRAQLPLAVATLATAVMRRGEAQARS
ncbi:hypothetical protein [Deinococcus reticulitermitis]|nr:hypothetical protein [Deinococcus reticulitermitis]